MKIYKIIISKNISILAKACTVLIALFIIGCIGVKPGSEPGGKKLFETFYAGEQGSQYFIKPLVLKNATKEKLTIDFSFRYKTEVKDSAIVYVFCFDYTRSLCIQKLKVPLLRWIDIYYGK